MVNKYLLLFLAISLFASFKNRCSNSNLLMKYSNLRVKQDTSLFSGLNYIVWPQDTILDVFKSNDKLLKKHEVKEKKIIDFVFKSIRAVQIQNYESSITKNFKVFSLSRVVQKNDIILNYFYVENNDKSNDSQCEQIICIVSHNELIKSFIVLHFCVWIK